MPPWPLKSAQSRPASLKHVKLLMIQFFLSFSAWPEIPIMSYSLDWRRVFFSRARLLKCTRKGEALTSARTNTDSSIRLDVEKQNSETSRMVCWMGACWWVRRRWRCHPGAQCSGDFPGASSTGAAVCQKLTAGDLWRPLCSLLQANTKSNCCLFLSKGSFLRLKWVLQGLSPGALF